MSDTPTTTDAPANDNNPPAANDNAKAAEGSPAQQNPEAANDNAEAADQSDAKTDAAQNDAATNGGAKAGEGSFASRDPMAGQDAAEAPQPTQDQVTTPEPAQDQATTEDQAETQETDDAEGGTEDADAEIDYGNGERDDAVDDARAEYVKAELKAAAQRVLATAIDGATLGALPPELRDEIVQKVSDVAGDLTDMAMDWFDDWMSKD